MQPDFYGSRPPGTVYTERQQFSFIGFSVAVIVVLIACALIVVFTHYYFGVDGVRVFAIGAILVFVVLLVWGITLITQRITQKHTQTMMWNITQAMIAQQQSDDKGEIGRQMATIQAAYHDSHLTARRLFTQAIDMSKEQQANQQNGFDISGLLGAGVGGDDDDEID